MAEHAVDMVTTSDDSQTSLTGIEMLQRQDRVYQVDHRIHSSEASLVSAQELSNGERSGVQTPRESIGGGSDQNILIGGITTPVMLQLTPTSASIFESDSIRDLRQMRTVSTQTPLESLPISTSVEEIRDDVMVTVEENDSIIGTSQQNEISQSSLTDSESSTLRATPTTQLPNRELTIQHLVSSTADANVIQIPNSGTPQTGSPQSQFRDAEILVSNSRTVTLTDSTDETAETSAQYISSPAPTEPEGSPLGDISLREEEKGGSTSELPSVSTIYPESNDYSEQKYPQESDFCDSEDKSESNSDEYDCANSSAIAMSSDIESMVEKSPHFQEDRLASCNSFHTTPLCLECTEEIDEATVNENPTLMSSFIELVQDFIRSNFKNFPLKEKFCLAFGFISVLLMTILAITIVVNAYLKFE
ncbi:uncharacterized protein LOC142343964 [Convolutriloba macropyga]|uniref:uncharacterized protein LOC142343964 n=1 Tax=Convolutriloba macropyga TaxID=536237 RepID=UPI003F528126